MWCVFLFKCKNIFLFIFFRFLATGDSYGTLAHSYRVGIETVSVIIEETCQAISSNLMSIYMKKPTETDWMCISQRFNDRWNFPNCLGAIDGKHVVIQAPPNSGSYFFNYKGTYSVVLMAVVDADYRFRLIQVGDFGGTSNGGIYSRSAIGKKMEANSMNVPTDTYLPGSRHLGKVPYVLVGDAAFPLKKYLMRPYPGKKLPRNQRIYNYRQSRARRMVECCFGILSNRFRIYHRTINMLPRKVEVLIEATCLLHNFLVTPSDIKESFAEDNSSSASSTSCQGSNLGTIPHIGGNRASLEAFQVCDIICEYFVSEQGKVYWQDAVVDATS